MIIAGDVGGTKTLLQLLEREGGAAGVVFEARYEDAAHADFAALLGAFLGEARAKGVHAASLDGAVFGVAAPVSGDRVRLTNRDWVIDAAAIASGFGIARVRLVNDFVAAASGIARLGHADLVTLQEGEPDERAPRIVLGSGTGLGIAYLVRNGGSYQVVAGEGGNAGFAPPTPLHAELWQALHARSGHVSVEQVVSGAGLVAIYEFLREQRAEPESAQPDRPGGDDDAAAAISALALEKCDPLASLALDVFIEAYGAAAGDHALALLARGGVFIAGGIAPRIIARLQSGRFMDFFRAKGRFAALMEGIPVHVVMNPKLGLLGAAAIALDMQ